MRKCYTVINYTYPFIALYGSWLVNVNNLEQLNMIYFSNSNYRSIVINKYRITYIQGYYIKEEHKIRLI